MQVLNYGRLIGELEPNTPDLERAFLRWSSATTNGNRIQQGWKGL